MESLLYRYRNITVLLVAICAQMILLAWQIKGENDIPLIRVWAITAITPVASLIENVRNGTTGFFGSYFALRDAREQARRLRFETDRLRIENQLLRNELANAQRTEALLGFQTRTPSRMVGARVIGTTNASGARSILIDRGTTSGIRKGMAVVTPSGIIGRVLSVYPFASQVMTITDPSFAAGVESQKAHLKGVLRGINKGQFKVDYIPGGQKLEPGELFFTSGDDRVYPKGFPAAKVLSATETSGFQEVIVQPSGIETPEEVLVIVDPVHQEIPEAAADPSPVFLAPDAPRPAAPPPDPSAPAATPQSGTGRGQMTQADKLVDQYRKIGEAQKFTFGEGGPGSTPPNFNIKIPPAAPPGAPNTAAPNAATPNTAPPKPANPVAVPPGSTVPRPVVSQANGPAAVAPQTATPRTSPPSVATNPGVSTPVQQPRPQVPAATTPPAANGTARPLGGSAPPSTAPQTTAPRPAVTAPGNQTPPVRQIPAPKPETPAQP